jgi:hypothetical protein
MRGAQRGKEKNRKREKHKIAENSKREKGRYFKNNQIKVC